MTKKRLREVSPAGENRNPPSRRLVAAPVGAPLLPPAKPRPKTSRIAPVPPPVSPPAAQLPLTGDGVRSAPAHAALPGVVSYLSPISKVLHQRSAQENQYTEHQQISRRIFAEYDRINNAHASRDDIARIMTGTNLEYIQQHVRAMLHWLITSHPARLTTGTVPPEIQNFYNFAMFALNHTRDLSILRFVFLWLLNQEYVVQNNMYCADINPSGYMKPALVRIFAPLLKQQVERLACFETSMEEFVGIMSQLQFEL